MIKSSYENRDKLKFVFVVSKQRKYESERERERRERERERMMYLPKKIFQHTILSKETGPKRFCKILIEMVFNLNFVRSDLGVAPKVRGKVAK